MSPRPNVIAPVAITAYTATCAAGHGSDALAQAIAEQRSGLHPNDFSDHPLATWIGRVAGIEQVALPPHLASWDCRATRLAWLGLQPDGFTAAVQAACERHGAGRVGLVLGTSASTIGASEEAYRRLDADGRFPEALRSAQLNTPHALATFVQTALQLAGPCLTVSTACSSSAKALASAERWLRLGLVDAVVVAGVDALCASVLFGFQALQLLSPNACRPFDAQRSGISVGEAAAYALLERGQGGPGALQLLGYGESNDAHHMSSPHPQGLGAEAALDDALARSGLTADAIDHLNLHGTASAQNDAVEAALVARRYAAGIHAGATKGVTGHTMGAAGLLEAVVCLLALERGLQAGSPGTEQVDAALGQRFGQQLGLRASHAPVRHAASHSFGFGGNNCVLVFGREGDGPHRAEQAEALRGGSTQAQAVRFEGGAASGLNVFIDATALWPPAGETAARPSPALLGANERRRAPDSVLVALEVAQRAVSQAAMCPATLASVFTSAHGDLAIVDALCTTLADDPLRLSPTRFHHSVHNAASGYWAMTSGSRAGSGAVSGHTRSFAAGWLEAASLCAADQRPVLLVGVDTEARGALASVNRSRGLLGVALLLTPQRTARSAWRMGWSLAPGAVDAPPVLDPALNALADNAMADALPLFEALQRGVAASLALPLGPALALRFCLRPQTPPAAASAGA